MADGDRLVEFHEPQQLEWMKARLIEIDNLGLAVGWPWWVGGTDATTEDRWLWSGSSEPVAAWVWAGSQPHPEEDTYDCMQVCCAVILCDFVKTTIVCRSGLTRAEESTPSVQNSTIQSAKRSRHRRNSQSFFKDLFPKPNALDSDTEM